MVAAIYVLSDRGKPKQDGSRFVLKNPFELLEVLKFGLVLTVISAAVVLARRLWGDTGLLALAAISGLADVDAITLSVSRLGGAETVAVTAILLTVARQHPGEEFLCDNGWWRQTRLAGLRRHRRGGGGGIGRLAVALNPLAHQIVLLGLDDPYTDHVALLQARSAGNEHVAIDFRRVPG